MTVRADAGRTPSICEACGSESPAGARFCMQCAAPLREVLELYREIGAAGHAERLARELAA